MLDTSNGIHVVRGPAASSTEVDLGADSPYRVAEFFAGIGLVRAGLERGGPYEVAWANDIERDKAALYKENYRDEGAFHLGDVRAVSAQDIPAVSLATASFPCTDLSLAGGRRGLSGGESSMFWEFARLLCEMAAMGSRLPSVTLLENVPGFATSRGGRDLADAVRTLNSLGYTCDIIGLDARWFVPQSRPRMFVVGVQQGIGLGVEDGWAVSALRPPWVQRFVQANPTLKMHARSLVPPEPSGLTLADCVERLPQNSEAWWEFERLDRFVSSLSQVQRARLEGLRAADRLSWRTAYRRTRNGRAVWEIRADEIAGCLRTARGGSSKQAVVEAGRGHVRVRWMTPQECAALQGAPDYSIDGFRANQVYFGFGDAVCVPVISWIAKNYINAVLDGA